MPKLHYKSSLQWKVVPPGETTSSSLSHYNEYLIIHTPHQWIFTVTKGTRCTVFCGLRQFHALGFPDCTHYPLIRALRSVCVIVCCQGWRSVNFQLHPYGNCILCEDRWESSSTFKLLWTTGWHTFVSKCTNWRPFLWLSLVESAEIIHRSDIVWIPAIFLLS